MKILYGVQATGQGHISRARAMAAQLNQLGVDVTWLFSGRPREQLFDMEPFGYYKHRRGLTFAARAGRIRYRETLRTNQLRKLARDVTHLDLSPYDLVVTDYEPVVAWAARRAGRRSIGIGHQYAFGPHTPVRGDNWLSRNLLRWFAPVDVPLGLHWHPYAGNILPPILDLPPLPVEKGEHILVYLPFEDQDSVTRLLQEFPERRFAQYASGLQAAVKGNVVLRPASIDAFKFDLARSAGVICNSGFELISECLQWRKPVLTKPLSGQVEQLSNALALAQLHYASVAPDLSRDAINDWLEAPVSAPDIHFSDVASLLAKWLASGCTETAEELAQRAWSSPCVRASILERNRAA